MIKQADDKPSGIGEVESGFLHSHIILHELQHHHLSLSQDHTIFKWIQCLLTM